MEGEGEREKRKSQARETDVGNARRVEHVVGPHPGSVIFRCRVGSAPEIGDNPLIKAR